MKKILLAPYSIKIRKEYGKEYEPLGSFNNDDDLLEIIFETISMLKTKASLDTIASHAIETENVEINERMLEGFLNSGEYGTETTIRDVKTWGIAHRKKKHHAEMLPFYFCFYLPSDEDTGMLLLQRIGLMGVLHAFVPLLDASVKKKFPGYKLVVNPFVPSGLLEQYLGSGATMSEIKFIRHSLSSDIAGHLSGGNKTKGTMTLVVNLRESKSFPFQANIRRYFAGKRGLQDLIELDDTRFAYDNVKIKMLTGGIERTVDLGHPERLRAAFDITDKIEYGSNGHPDPKSISSEARGILDDLIAIKYGKE